MTAWTDALAALFGNADFGAAATYTPPGGGAATACRVILDRSDRDVSAEFTKGVVAGTTIEVRASEVAAPAPGGTFVVAGTTYKVRGSPVQRDADRLVWACTVEAQ